MSLSSDAASLYSAEVMHQRFTTAQYRFRYRIFSVLLDIDDIERAAVSTRLFSLNRFNLLSFHDRDHLPEGEGDQTVMRISVEGVPGGKRVRRTWDMLDRFDHSSGVSSMARTTGYTCTAAVRALAAGLYHEPGLVPPEVLGRTPGVYDFIVARLAERGVTFAVADELVTG